MKKNLPMYELIDDDDGHWYVILVSEEPAFAKWLAAAPYWEGYRGKDFNDCRVNGPHAVQFSMWSERP